MLIDMKIKPIKNIEFLQNSICIYSDFWDLVWRGHDEKQACRFDGSSEDLDMLDYCEYEVGHPVENYDSAAIIWGNVIQKNTLLKWGEDENENIYLYSDQYPRFSINVKEYVHGVIHSNISQFESFSILTEKIALEMLIAQFPYDDIADLSNIVFEFSVQGGDSYSERMKWAIRELYKSKGDKIDELQKSLKGDKNV